MRPKRMRKDERGRMSGSAAVTLVVALAVAGILAGLVLPIGINAITEDTSTSFSSVSEGDTVSVSPVLNATLDDVNQSNSDITVTVNDTEAGTSSTFTNVTTNTTQTLEGEDITVILDSVDSTTTASFTVEYPPDYSFGSGAKSIWGILDLVIVLAVFLFLIGMALVKSGRF